MRFQILGPLRVQVGDRDVSITAPRERVALAVLLLHASEMVPVPHLVDAIWSDEPPLTARNQVQASVSRLRRLLTPAGSPATVIATELGGYRLQIDRHDVDLHEFRSLVVAARAAGSLEEARDLYRSAVGLWRGPVLTGFDSIELGRVASALEEERIQALEECLDIEFWLGAAGQLVAELTELVRQHSYREGLRATLMRALYQSGRSADALAEYQRFRALLRDELGTEPGKELQRLHKAILNQDPDLSRSPVPASPTPAMPGVRELPAEPSQFVGRGEEIARVRTALLPHDRDGIRRPTVVVVYGPGGVGKSALAVRVAHDLAADYYPDGQLYVDLCGSTPGMRPLAAVEVLGRFLRRLGVPPEQIPTELFEAAALFRSATTDRQLLLVLDNAAGPDQVWPLVPASPRCGVLVTSRYPLASLDIDHRLRLGVLDNADGLTLLTSLTGRLASEPEAAQSILSLSAGLPLAIRIAAGRLACRPDLSSTEYAQRLADRSRRLDELELEDLAIRASIRTSYDALLSGRDPAGALAARAFRVLGLLHVPDVASGVVAAMLSEPDVETARAALDRLVDAQLLVPSGASRYRLHDLVRLVAAERAIEEDPTDSREAAVGRAMSYYAGALWHADHILQPGRVAPNNTPPRITHLLLPQFRGPLSADAWIDRELPNLVPISEQLIARTEYGDKLAAWFGDAYWSCLDSRCEWQVAYRFSRRLLEAVKVRDDLRLTACALLLHGRSEACLGQYDVARAHLGQALAAMRELDDHRGAALALTGLGVVETRCKASGVALVWYADALDLATQHDLQRLAAVVLSNMAVPHAYLGQLTQALSTVRRSAEISTAIGAFDRLASAINNLAAVSCLLDDYASAQKYAEQAVALARQAGHRRVECEALVTRTETNLRLGDYAVALEDAQRALSAAQASGYRHMIAAASRQKAKTLAALGRTAEAMHVRKQATEAYDKLTEVSLDPMTELLIGRQPLP